MDHTLAVCQECKTVMYVGSGRHHMTTVMCPVCDAQRGVSETLHIESE
jgi:uncharacterized Zn finger protein (UPF0148 family)